MTNWIHKTKKIAGINYFLLLVLLFLVVEPTLELWAMRETDNLDRNYLLPIFIAIGGIIAAQILQKSGCKAIVSGRSFWVCLTVAVLFNLILNQEIWQLTHQLSNALLLTMGLIFATYAVLRRFCFIIWVPLCFLLTVQLAAMKLYNIDLNAEIIAQIFNANADEIIAYLTFRNSLLIILVLFAAGLCAYIMYKGMRKEHSLTLLYSAAICFFGLYTARYYLQPIYYNQDCGLWPVKALNHIRSQAIQGVKENNEIRDLIYNLPSATTKPSSSSILKGGEGITLVLHIGESVTSDHLQSHGYHRNTMPFVQSYENTIHFKDCTSSSVFTLYAIPTILTNGRRGYDWCKDPAMGPSVSSFANLLVKHTFRQYCLFDHGTLIFTGGQNTLPKILQKLTEEATATHCITGLPMEQIPQLQKILRDTPKDNKFILINNDGSHVPYSKYDSATAAFPQIDSKFDESPAENALVAQKTINDYDNTIHYTDQYIREAVFSMRGKPFLYIYISDHGEYLGENGKWSRGSAKNGEISFFATQGCRIPFFIIYSPELQELHPHFAEAIKNLKKNANIRTAHEHIFHTILGIAGINSPYYKPELDLSSTKAMPYTGPHPQDKK